MILLTTINACLCWCFPPTDRMLVGENTNKGGEGITSRPRWCCSPTGIALIVGGEHQQWRITLIVGGNTNNGGHKIIYRCTNEKEVILHCNPPLLVFSTNKLSAPVGVFHQQAFRYLLVETPTRASFINNFKIYL